MATPTYTPLANVTLSSSASSVTFSSIPATYRDLVVVANGVLASSSGDVRMRFNGDTGSNYSTVTMEGTGTSALSSSFTSSRITLTPRSFWETTGRNSILVSVMDYSTTNKHKSVLARSNNASIGVDAQANRWANTAAITSVELFVEFGPSFATGSTFALYGIAA